MEIANSGKTKQKQKSHNATNSITNNPKLKQNNKKKIDCKVPTKSTQFDIDLQNLKPWSPQVRSQTQNQLKSKANELATNQNMKKEQQINFKRNQSSQQYASNKTNQPKTFTLKMDELVNCFKESGNKDIHVKKLMNSKSKDNKSKLKLKKESRNSKERFIPIKADPAYSNNTEQGKQRTYSNEEYSSKHKATCPSDKKWTSTQSPNLRSQQKSTKGPEDGSSFSMTAKTPQIGGNKLEQKKVQFELDMDENKQSINDDFSDFDQEEELREEVGDLPPKIEDLQVEEYDDNEEEDDELPTVVIDTSVDEIKETFENEGDNANNEACASNIQAALKSIQVQEEQEQKKDKKKVTIMTVQEEQALEQQINDIRHKIKNGQGSSQKRSIEGDINSNKNYEIEPYKDLQIDVSNHFRSVDGLNLQNGLQNKVQSKTTTSNDRYNMKPPLYSQTFAHPHEESDQESNPLAGINKNHAFSSIDQNAPVDYITMDDPNIYQKKKQRYERIQKIRGNAAISLNSDPVDLNSIANNDITPVERISSTASANMASQKKSVDRASINNDKSSQGSTQIKRYTKPKSLKYKNAFDKPEHRSRQSQHSLLEKKLFQKYSFVEKPKQELEIIGSTRNSKFLSKQKTSESKTTKKSPASNKPKTKLNSKQPSQRGVENKSDKNPSSTKQKKVSKAAILQNQKLLQNNAKFVRVGSDNFNHTKVNSQSVYKVQTPQFKKKQQSFSNQSKENPQLRERMSDVEQCQPIIQLKQVGGKSTKHQPSKKTFFKSFVQKQNPNSELQTNNQDQDRRKGNYSLYLNKKQNSSEKKAPVIDLNLMNEFFKNHLPTNVAYEKMKERLNGKQKISQV